MSRIAAEITSKSPEEVIRFSAVFPADTFATGETITGITTASTSKPTGLTVSATFSGQVVEYLISGGVVDVNYVVSTLFGTSNGQDLHGKLVVQINDVTLVP